MTTQPVFDPYREERLLAEANFDAGNVEQAIKAAAAIDRAQAQLAQGAPKIGQSVPL